jgi:hypothetical protein
MKVELLSAVPTGRIYAWCSFLLEAESTAVSPYMLTLALSVRILTQVLLVSSVVLAEPSGRAV